MPSLKAVTDTPSYHHLLALKFNIIYLIYWKFVVFAWVVWIVFCTQFFLDRTLLNLKASKSSTVVRYLLTLVRPLPDKFQTNIRHLLETCYKFVKQLSDACQRRIKNHPSSLTPTVFIKKMTVGFHSIYFFNVIGVSLRFD